MARSSSGVGLSPGAGRGPAALLPPGTRGLAIPDAPTGRPPFEVGDRVDLVATIESADGVAETAVVAVGVLVVAVGDEAVTVAIPTDDLATVVEALVTGAVTLALAP